MNKIPAFCFLKPNVHYRYHNSPPLLPVLSKISSVHTIRTDFFKKHINIINLSTPRSFKYSFILVLYIVQLFVLWFGVPMCLNVPGWHLTSEPRLLSPLNSYVTRCRWKALEHVSVLGSRVFPLLFIILPSSCLDVCRQLWSGSTLHEIRSSRVQFMCACYGRNSETSCTGNFM